MAPDRAPAHVAVDAVADHQRKPSLGCGREDDVTDPRIDQFDTSLIDGLGILPEDAVDLPITAHRCRLPSGSRRTPTPARD